MWIKIEGYRWPYRIDEGGHFEKCVDNIWIRLQPYLSGRTKACVRVQTKEGKRKDIPLVDLMADAFMGGKKPGECIIHKNGSKSDCSLGNLQKVTLSECGKISSRSRRGAVAKIDREGHIVQIYPSAKEAAQKNHISQTAVWHRCNNMLKHPFELDGHNYKYMDS